MPKTEKMSLWSYLVRGCFAFMAATVLFFLLGCLAFGVLIYLEKGRRDDHSDIHLIIAVEKGVPTKFRIERKYNSATYINIWARGPGLVYIKGSIKCSYYKASGDFDSKEEGRPTKTDGPQKYLWLHNFTFLSVSSKRRPANCVVTFTELVGTGPVEIVVTGAPPTLDKIERWWKD